MICPFNTHSLVSYKGHTYGVSSVVWSADEKRYTLGLTGYDFRCSVFWVPADSVQKVSK